MVLKNPELGPKKAVNPGNHKSSDCKEVDNQTLGRIGQKDQRVKHNPTQKSTRYCYRAVSNELKDNKLAHHKYYKSSLCILVVSV